MIVAACVVWVGAPLLAAVVAGRPAPNPVAGLVAADVQQAGALAAAPASGGPVVVTALAQAPVGQAQVRIDLLSAPSAPRAVLLRNSVRVGRFDGSSVAITVEAGDLLEIDGSAYKQPLTFQVVAAEGLAAPAPGTRATTRGDIVPIGRVRLQTP